MYCPFRRRQYLSADVVDQSGDSPDIPIVRMGESIAEVSDRWRVIKKMDMPREEVVWMILPQYNEKRVSRQ